jgi:glycosyltransferase involved in cell wall biosynthesis
MSEKNKPIKIAFLTMHDPHDRRRWSGLIYYAAQALQKYCGEVEIEYCYFFSTFSYKIINLIGAIVREGSIKLLKKRDTCSFFLAKCCAIGANRWIARHSFDVIVAPDGAIETAFLETDIPIVLIGDSTKGQLIDYYPWFSNLLKRSIYENHTVQSMALKKASAALYSSTWAAQSAIKDYATDPQKVHVVPFGANFDENPPRELALSREKSQQCRLLFLGVEWQRKGGEIAFETLLKLEEMGIEAELIVCGCVPPKKFVHRRMKVIPFLNKNDPRQREELNKLFLHADFLFVPTRGECYGLVFCEANAFGLPVIATNTGGVSEIVRDGENGYLLPPDAGGSAYAELIAKVYYDDQHYAEMVKASRTAFEERLNWAAWGMTTKKILTELLHHH